MTGPEHYERAEELLSSAEDWDAANPDERPYMELAYAAAQVHARLALAAATAIGLDVPPPDYSAWRQVCGVKPT